MPANLSIKNAPDEVVSRLKERAAKHHRSLNGELLSILEEATQPKRGLSIDEAIAKLNAIGVTTPSEGTAMIRADRDSR